MLSYRYETGTDVASDKNDDSAVSNRDAKLKSFETEIVLSLLARCSCFEERVWKTPMKRLEVRRKRLRNFRTHDTVPAKPTRRRCL